MDQIDRAESESEFVSSDDSSRELFSKHPWSIGGGGASELKEKLEGGDPTKLDKLTSCIGFSAILGEDEGFGGTKNTNHMRRLDSRFRRPIIEGEKVRDWGLDYENEVLFPYTSEIELIPIEPVENWIWPIRAVMESRKDFSRETYKECGRPYCCLLYTSPSPRDATLSRMPSSA